MGAIIDAQSNYCSELYGVLNQLNEQIFKINSQINSKISDVNRSINKVKSSAASYAPDLESKTIKALAKINEYAPDVTTMSNSLNSILQQCFGKESSNLVETLGNLPGELSSAIFNKFLDKDSAVNDFLDLIESSIKSNFSSILGSIIDLPEGSVISGLKDVENDIKDTGIKDIIDTADKILNCLTSVCPDFQSQLQDVIDNINTVQSNLYLTDDSEFDKKSFVDDSELSTDMKTNINNTNSVLDGGISSIKTTASNDVVSSVSEIRKETGFE